MPKEIILVYQDCPMCGSREEWGEKQIAAAKANDTSIRKVSFVTEEGRKYCAEALKAGKASMPFFTDGEGHFERSVEELCSSIIGAGTKDKAIEIEKPAKKSKKKSGRKNVNKKQNS